MLGWSSIGNVTLGGTVMRKILQRLVIEIHQFFSMKLNFNAPKCMPFETVRLLQIDELMIDIANLILR